VQPRSRVRWPSSRVPSIVCFHAIGGFLSSYRPLNQLSFRFILPWRSSSSEFLRVHLLLASFEARSPTQGLFPLRGITGGRPLIAQVAKPPLCSVLRFSQPLDGFLRPPALQACSIPQATSRVLAVQGLLSSRSRALSSRADASLPLSSQALTGAEAVRFWRSAVIGCRTRKASASRRSSTRGRVVCGLGSIAPQLAPLFGFRSSRSSTTVVTLVTQSHPLTAIPSGAVLARPLRPLSAFCRRRARFLRLRRNRPARAF